MIIMIIYLEDVDEPVGHLNVHLIQAVRVHHLTLAISARVQPNVGVIVGARNVLADCGQDRLHS